MAVRKTSKAKTSKAKKKNWVQAATQKNKGAFAASASRAGKTTLQYAKEKKDAPGVLGKRARLALTLAELRKKKAKK